MKLAAPVNVLVFPGGTEVGLEIFRALVHCKEVRLHAAASGVRQHADYCFRNYRQLPDVREGGCLDALLRLLDEWRIDVIYPANVLVMDFLNLVRAQLPCAIVMLSGEAYAITRSKRRTYDAVRDIVGVPRVFAVQEVVDFPVFVKPDRLYGSQRARVVRSSAELAAVPPEVDELVLEYLPGEEYTVDCFSSGDGLLFAGPRTRERIRMGTSMHSEPPADHVAEELKSIAHRIQDRLGMRGPWFFQMKRSHTGALKLLEVEARIAGTMALNRVRGVNFALLGVLDLLGIDVTVEPDLSAAIAIDRALTSRYRHPYRYDVVYVDLDDTLIVKGRLNVEMVKFLYQCVNEGKRIELLTKCTTEDPMAILKRWRLGELFDAVHWIGESDSKTAYITNPCSIFIDDSFTQRQDVRRQRHIPTFDPSMVELLLDDRAE